MIFSFSYNSVNTFLHHLLYCKFPCIPCIVYSYLLYSTAAGALLAVWNWCKQETVSCPNAKIKDTFWYQVPSTEGMTAYWGLESFWLVGLTHLRAGLDTQPAPCQPRCWRTKWAMSACWPYSISDTPRINTTTPTRPRLAGSSLRQMLLEMLYKTTLILNLSQMYVFQSNTGATSPPIGKRICYRKTGIRPSTLSYIIRTMTPFSSTAYGNMINNSERTESPLYSVTYIPQLDPDSTIVTYKV